MTSMCMVEGKDTPEQRRQLDQFTVLHGKTGGLLLNCLQSGFHTDRVVILDSSFCVLTTLIELRSFGLYASIVIKKEDTNLLL